MKWEDLTFQRANTTAGSHQAYTLVDIIGSGFLIGIWYGDEESSLVADTMTTAVQIDGGTIEPWNPVQGYAFLGMGFRRFESSLKVTIDQPISGLEHLIFVVYLLD